MIALPLLKLHIRHALAEDDTTEDALLEEYEAAAVAFVERYTGRYFGEPVARTEYLVGTGAQEVWLSETPAGAVAVLSNDVAVDAGDFTVRGRRLRHASIWGAPWLPTDLAVTYTAGYAAGEEPADIRVAVMELVGKMYEYRTAVAEAVLSEVPMGVRETLNAWRRIPV